MNFSPKFIALAKSILSLIGIAIAAYLFLTEPTGTSSNSSLFLCPGQSPRGIINCTAVVTSAYSHIFGLPLSFLALAWFLFLFSLSVLQRKGDKVIEMLSAYSSIASIFAVFYSSLAMFEIGYICIYCSTLDVILLIIFFIGLAEAKRLMQQLTPQIDNLK